MHYPRRTEVAEANSIRGLGRTSFGLVIEVSGAADPTEPRNLNLTEATTTEFRRRCALQS
jgi:hypothetical protein